MSEKESSIIYLKDTLDISKEDFSGKEISSYLKEQVKILLGKVFCEEIKDEDLKLKFLHGGTTNAVLKVDLKRKKKDDEICCVVRIDGSNKKDDLMINKSKEMEALKELSKINFFCPRIFSIFQNGSVMNFISGRNITLSEVQHENHFKKIANTLVLMHSFNIRNQKNKNLKSSYQENVTNWFKNIKDSTFSHQRINNLIKKEILQEEIEIMQQQIDLQFSNEDLSLCHNDLYAGNIIYDENFKDEDDKDEENNEKDQFFSTQHMLIDFEYAGVNFRQCDVADYLTEFGGLELDYSKTNLNEKTIKKFIEFYSNAKINLTNLNKNNKTNKEDDLMDFVVDEDNFYYKVMLGMCLQHLHWACWGLIQFQNSCNSTSSFDYASYAIKRFILYKQQKEEYYKIIKKK